jgi:hypothetical protein
VRTAVAALDELEHQLDDVADREPAPAVAARDRERARVLSVRSLDVGEAIRARGGHRAKMARIVRSSQRGPCRTVRFSGGPA